MAYVEISPFLRSRANDWPGPNRAQRWLRTYPRGYERGFNGVEAEVLSEERSSDEVLPVAFFMYFR